MTMLQIRTCDGNDSYRRLFHSESVFHDAIKYVLQGETDFHIVHPDDKDYCLHYVVNNDWAMEGKLYPRSKHMEEYPQYPPYLNYDEDDTSKMSFDIISGIEKVFFKELNEYTVTVAKILLKHTDLKLFFSDERVKRFLPESERLIVTDKWPDADDEKTLRVIDSFYPAAIFGDNNQVDQIYCFHHIFFFQGLSELPLKRIKYARLSVPKSEGIGSILSVYARMKNFFDRYGIRICIRRSSSRYPDVMLKKYFDLCIEADDCDENNTVDITNFFSAWMARLVGRTCTGQYDLNCLDPLFREQMEEYAKAVIADKRMLGVLLRGSDFFISDMAALTKPVKVEHAIPVIEEWMKEDKYDGIILATEDEDMLEAMREAFGNKVITVAQERYRVSQFSNAETIAELQHELLKGKEYDEHLEDMTVNYFYAVYLLSKCESFIYSNLCGGERLTHIFNGGRFKKDLCLAQLFLKKE